jgi:hypothetical protein
LGVDVAEIERMDKEGAPIAMGRLILLWDKKHINAQDWGGLKTYWPHDVKPNTLDNWRRKFTGFIAFQGYLK